MLFERIYEPGLAQASYFIGCQASGEAIVIDPKRDIDSYLQFAEQKKMNIKYVTETHIHADFLSGARELAKATGAELLLSAEGGPDWRYKFKHTPLKEGDRITVGNLKLDVWHTPGHTPEHISFLLTDTPSIDEPVMIFTGDFVFVGDVGRPDLLEKAAGISGTQETGARQMFNSLKRFKALPDYIQVWPGHGAGSACGKALGAVPGSTVGYEKIANWALKYDNEEEFVKALLDGQPEPPKYFAMMKKLNKEERSILKDIPEVKKLSMDELIAFMNKDIPVVDTRQREFFSRAHIPGALNIHDNNSFSNWAGWILEYDQPFVLIASENRINDLTRALIRIGLDNIGGYFSDIEVWEKSSRKMQSFVVETADQLSKNIDSNNIQVIDVRALSEFNEGRIPGSTHIHLGYLKDRLDEVDRQKNKVMVCASGARSAIAASLLQANGFEKIINLEGGFDAWKNAGYPVEK